MFLTIGAIAFALTTLYLNQDAGEPVHKRVAQLLARLGWREVPHPNNPGVMGLAPRKWRGAFRLLWQLQDCPYCISTWVSFFATWYVLSVGLWTKAFWSSWWASVGVAWLAIAVYKVSQDAIVELGARDEDRHAQHD